MYIPGKFGTIWSFSIVWALTQHIFRNNSQIKYLTAIRKFCWLYYMTGSKFACLCSCNNSITLINSRVWGPIERAKCFPVITLWLMMLWIKSAAYESTKRMDFFRSHISMSFQQTSKDVDDWFWWLSNI